MKKLFKLSAITFCLALVFSGCNTQIIDTGLGTITKEELDPETIGYYSSLKLPLDKNGTKISIICDTSVETNNESVVIQELRRRTGIDLQIINIQRAVFQEKTKVLLASKNEMPDIYQGGFSIDEINDFGMQGAFAPINKQVDKLPNFKEIFYDKAEDYKTANKLKGFAAADGNLYIFPTYDIDRAVNHGLLYRKDIFDLHGIKPWTNQDEFYQSLKKLKEFYPNSTPMVSKSQSLIFTNLGYSWGLNGLGPYYNEEEKAWKISSVDPKYHSLLNFMKKLYDEGLLDPEFLTTTQAAWTSKMTQKEKAFVTWDWIGRLDMFYDQAKEAIPGYDLRYAYPIGGKVRTLPNVTSGPSVKNGKNSLLAMQLLDYMISPSGARLISMGIPGVTYEEGKNGFAKYIGFADNQPVGIDALEEKYGLFISGLYRRFDKKSTYYNYSEKEQEAQDMMLNKPGGGFYPEDPSLAFLPEEKEVIAKYLPGLTKAAEEFSTQYILSSQTGEEAWKTWLEKAESLGASEILKIYTAAQIRYDTP